MGGSMKLKTTLFVGSYTQKEPHAPLSRGVGLTAFTLDLVDGTLTAFEGSTSAGINPTFLCGTRSTLYVSNECYEPSQREPGAKTGFLASFAIGEDGSLTESSRQETGSETPCHVSLSPSQDFLIASNFGGGSVTLFPLREDGTIEPLSDLHRYPGEGSHSSQMHSSVWIPGSDVVMAADRGSDRIAQLKLDRAAKKLIPSANAKFVTTPTGSGPRHFAIHPSQKFVFIAGELSNAVMVFGINPIDKSLTAKPLHIVSTLPEDFQERNLTAEIHASTDGKFLYVSNRGHDSIAVFKVDDATGALELVQLEPTRGNWPRTFLVVGSFLVVANLNSHSLVVLSIDKHTGKLSFTGHSAECASPLGIFAL